MMQTRTKKLTTLAMLSAIAYIVMVFGRIPVVLFLKYDPKDVVIAIGGFLYGPLAALMMSFTVSFVEMLTVSDTGPIGLVMNVISTCAFCCVAATIYKKKHTIFGAAAGLVIGALTATCVMLLWNYFLVPIYMGMPRETIAEMLIPAFLPFNLLKGGLNASITMLVYKPVKRALLKAGMFPVESDGQPGAGLNTGVAITAVFVIVTCGLLILVLQGII